jgi:hypothetical protein
MSLSCYCGEWDEADWYWTYVENFSVLKRKRAKKCCSCKEVIRPGEECVEFFRHRDPRCDIEERIYNDEVPLTSWYHCAKCGEQFFNLTALGFCFQIDENMFDLLKEYHELTGFKP